MKSAVNRFEMWWPGTELNRRRQPFQGCALPPELPGHISKHTQLLQLQVGIRFTPIVAGLPIEKQLQCWTRAQRFDYSKARHSLKLHSRTAPVLR
jgi:hypothetical protein